MNCDSHRLRCWTLLSHVLDKLLSLGQLAPAATSLIFIFCYLSLDYEMKRKAAAYNIKAKKPTENPKAVAKFEWRAKVNSPVVEDAIDHFIRHMVSEWVTDLWYSRLTPDKEAPEELKQLINGVLSEISGYSSQFTVGNASFHTDKNGSTRSSVTSYKDDEHNHFNMHTSESESNTSYNSEDDETSNVTGLDSPGTKVWDGRSNRNQAVSYGHHPLEIFDNHSTKKRKLLEIIQNSIWQ